MSCNIEDVWKVEQEILDVFHKVCVDNNLKYSIAYGTLLGAVRHKGFIPWDDDIDVIMPREDYEKLRTLWVKNAPKKYIFQDYYTDKNYINNFAKIRKDKTAFVQSEKEKDFNYHKGIFIDVFPADRVPNSSMSRKFKSCMWQLTCCMHMDIQVAVKVLWEYLRKYCLIQVKRQG